MASNMSEFEKAVEILRTVTEGREDVRQALVRWPAPEKSADRLLKDAWHALYHYMADQDIRQREPDYEEHQKAILNRYVTDLAQAIRDKRHA